jgi:nuclease S1
MKHRLILAVVVLFVSGSTSFGWGPEGHYVVARIAELNLTPRTKAAVAELLGKESLTDVATWADAIRKQPDYAWSGKLHGATVAGDAPAFKMKRDCADGCAVSAIIRFTDTLEKPGADRKARIEALKFLVHFVGDVHEPIHVSSARQLSSHRNKIEFFSEPATLHVVWDALLIRHTGKAPEAYAKELRAKITAAQLTEWSAETDPAVWANESYEMAMRFVYVLPDDGKLGQQYFDRSIPVVNERLSKAGVRLAARLNGIFDPKPPARGVATSAPAALRR